MKPIKITEANVRQIAEALAAAEGRATRRCLGARDVFEVIGRAEQRLGEWHLPIKERTGIMLRYNEGGPSANAYKYSAQATEVVLRRGTSAWFLVEVRRVTVYPKQNETFRFSISPAQKMSVMNHLLAHHFRGVDICTVNATKCCRAGPDQADHRSDLKVAESGAVSERR